MKVICCDLPYADNIEIHALSDLHLGDVHCEYKAIAEKLAYIQNTPNAYCLLDGDLMDAAIASSVGDTYSASMQPMEQLKQCVKLFKPLAEAGKILVEKAQSSVAYVDRLFVNTAAWLRFGGYGEVQGFKPASLSTPVIYLSGKEKRMWAKL